MSIRMHIAPRNEDLLNAAFKELGYKAIRRVTRAAVSKAARHLAKQVRIKVKTIKFDDSGGFLQRSIGHKLYTAKTGHIGAVIGPRRAHSGFFYSYRRGKSDRGKLLTGRIRARKADLSAKPTKRLVKDLTAFGKRNVVGKPVFRNPTRYGHLVERGTSKTAAKPFLRPTRDANVRATNNIMANNIRDGIKKEAAKLAKKTARFKRRQSARTFAHRRNF